MFDELAWNPKFEITSEPEPDEELLVSSDMLIEKTPELPGIEFGTANPDNSPVMFGGPPNIVGQTPYGVFQGSEPNGFQGALYYVARNGTGNIISGGNYWTSLGFDASKSDTTYAGDQVQVSSLQVLACIKT